MDDPIELEVLDRNSIYPNKMLLDYLNKKQPMYDFLKKNPKKLHTVKFTGDRSLLKEVLLKYNKSINAHEESIKNIEQIENEDIYFVVTGQQPGFLTGPLYTIYKTFAAINYAEKFSSEKIKLIPVFWNASEDHDVEEVNNIRILNRKNEIVPLVIDPCEAMGKSLEKIQLHKCSCNDIVSTMLETFPETDFTDMLFNEIIKLELEKSEMWGDFFSRIMTRLFGKWGLVLVEPWIFRPHLTDYFSKLIEKPIHYNQIFLKTTNQLFDLGYKPKMHKKEDIVGLFYIDEENFRNTITIDKKGAYHISNGSTLTKEQILDELQSNPERFSTNAIYRPLAQDTMMPTHIFVGGPSEIGYHIQIKDLYPEFGLKQSNLQFRMGATVLERHINRIVAKYDVNLAELKDTNKLTSRLLRAENKEFLANYFDQITNTLDDMNKNLTDVSQELGKRAEGRKQKIIKELNNIERMYLKYVKDDNQVLQAQLQKAKAYVFPDDKPQERIFNIFQYLNKYSINMLDCMKDLMTKVDPGNHVVLKCWMF
ncbi:MAG: bacillithiol biosynthesis cysteine-adding enzyme BshC [Candidatus Heimdallarchaeota archaeon]|nr:bacillithiol biosynthesis cysteine-adding enzyme BshC [Candidatus Heimdallarchaeota archaeon]MCK4289780.1 bacillithiol biosynthesis cysteine-adding enzyme BshC [Candidatus Heimdallarchaeota archaeon]